MRKIHLANEKKRDAEVGFEMGSIKAVVHYVAASGEDYDGVQLLKSTVGTRLADLQQKQPDMIALGQSLIDGDPEVDTELVGRRLEDLRKVYVTSDGKVAYAVGLKEHVHAPDGTEKEVRPIVETPSNIALESLPVRWTGKMFPRSAAIRKFVFARSYQIHHVNGLTYDFLYDMARKLSETKSMMLVGAGEKGVGPIVLNNNSTPYRGFLEGRVDGEKYMLILHLTNLELKEIPND